MSEKQRRGSDCMDAQPSLHLCFRNTFSQRDPIVISNVFTIYCYNLKYKNKMWLYTCVISFLVGSALVAHAESKTVHVYSISSVLYAGIFCTEHLQGV